MVSTLTQMETLKSEGNSLYQSGSLMPAINKYEDALALANGRFHDIDSLPDLTPVQRSEETAKLKKLRASLFNNLATCYLRLD